MIGQFLSVPKRNEAEWRGASSTLTGCSTPSNTLCGNQNNSDFLPILNTCISTNFERLCMWGVLQLTTHGQPRIKNSNYFKSKVYVSIYKILPVEHIQNVKTCKLDRLPDGSLSSRYTGVYVYWCQAALYGQPCNAQPLYCDMRRHTLYITWNSNIQAALCDPTGRLPFQEHLYLLDFFNISSALSRRSH